MHAMKYINSSSCILFIMFFIHHLSRVYIRERSSIMSARFGGGLIRNADTADAGEEGGGVSDKMLTLLTLGS